jgi:hypothetical protein
MHPAGGIVPSDIPTVVTAAVVVPAPDIESQVRQEHTATEEFGDERAGMGMGIALFVLILVGIIGYIESYKMVLPTVDSAEAVGDDAYLREGYNEPYIFFYFGLIFTWICLLVAVVIASVLTCGCGRDISSKLKPHVKRWAKATLVALCLLLAVTVITNVSLGVQLRAKLLVIFCAIQFVLLSLALVFSGIFTWGSNGCSPRSSVSSIIPP